MRSLICLVAVILCSFVLSNRALADVRPADNGAPVFRIFAGAGGSSSAPIKITGKQPLLVVTAASDVQLSKDHKAVRIILTAPDARRFADITRKHAKELLIIEANGQVLEAMQVGAPVTNGVLEFVYPDDAKVADYLKKRFHLK